jgi:hypothetical protein
MTTPALCPATRDGQHCSREAGHDGDHWIVPSPPVVVRTYQARSNAEASRLFAAEATNLGQRGYAPGTPVWVGPPVGRRVVTPIILVIVSLFIAVLTVGAIWGLLVGVALSLVYVMAVKPNGVLTVTYTRAS